MLPSSKKEGHIALHISVGSPSQNNRKLKKSPPPFFFEAVKGAVVKLLACGTRGPGLEPGTRYFKFSDWLSLVLCLCIIQFDREKKKKGGVMLQMPPSEASGQ